MSSLTRREWIGAGGLGAAAVVLPARAAEPAPAAGKWRLGINTSTLRGASLEDKIRATAKAGFDSIELWSGDLSRHEKDGRPLEDLRKLLADLGLEVPNVIGIWNSMPVDEEEKTKRYEQLKPQLAQAAKVGAKHIAAVPGPDRPDLDVRWAAKRYRELLALGKEFGITVAIEFLGPIKGVHTLGQAAAIAIEADSPDARIVPDSFHLYRGGSSFAGVRYLAGAIYAVWHINDVPKEPEQFQLRDGDRILPGDGILPLPQLLRDLWASGFRGPLSVELFNQELWKKDPFEVARLCMEKMKALIAKSGVGNV
ncbi:MAG TPA: sugar phosphate isomerase/epimerase [Planctomycetota bacterium]|nr:sugar phosphate isomerase/epimerase [Planctomycetota bacterium]HRR81322.1 sugar phosphate isomerase/epimerase [Planctomycetota bacterium]HRT93398.1 sugar phosphate isomerase/epimerase [Planctomycetota bacterium]